MKVKVMRLKVKVIDEGQGHEIAGQSHSAKVIVKGQGHTSKSRS